MADDFSDHHEFHVYQLFYKIHEMLTEIQHYKGKGTQLTACRPKLTALCSSYDPTVAGVLFPSDDRQGSAAPSEYVSPCPGQNR